MKRAVKEEDEDILPNFLSDLYDLVRDKWQGDKAKQESWMRVISKDEDFDSGEEEFKSFQKVRPAKKCDDRKHSVSKEPVTLDKSRKAKKKMKKHKQMPIADQKQEEIIHDNPNADSDEDEDEDDDPDNDDDQSDLESEPTQSEHHALHQQIQVSISVKLEPVSPTHAGQQEEAGIWWDNVQSVIDSHYPSASAEDKCLSSP